MHRILSHMKLSRSQQAAVASDQEQVGCYKKMHRELVKVDLVVMSLSVLQQMKNL